MQDMATDRWAECTVAEGVWKYGGAVDEPVRIVGLAHDYWYSLGEADDRLEPDEEPKPLGPEGLLYYVVFAQIGGPGFATVLQAKAYAQSQVHSEIRWF